jgi:hypothetical protein
VRESGSARRATSWWLIVSHESNVMEVMALRLADGAEVLPVFSFEEEAKLFLRLGVPDGRWLVRETAAGELASLLLGPLSGVDRVALDPLPGKLGGLLVALLSIRRREFVARLLIDRGKPPTP